MKRLLCRLGLHHWHWKYLGRWHADCLVAVCQRCGVVAK